MAISQRLHTKLVQKLILTPSLQQAIKLLPMSTLELSELLNQEMVENPMLEETPSETPEQQETAQEKPEEKPAQEKGDTWDDQDYEYFFGDYLDDGYRPRTPTEVKELPPIENTLSTAALALGSPALAAVDADQRRVAAHLSAKRIIGNLDDDGYWLPTVDDCRRWGPWSDGRRRGRRSS
jgi:RNA polymerase sigma-54 factor